MTREDRIPLHEIEKIKQSKLKDFSKAYQRAKELKERGFTDDEILEKLKREFNFSESFLKSLINEEIVEIDGRYFTIAEIRRTVRRYKEILEEKIGVEEIKRELGIDLTKLDINSLPPKELLDLFHIFKNRIKEWLESSKTVVTWYELWDKIINNSLDNEWFLYYDENSGILRIVYVKKDSGERFSKELHIDDLPKKKLEKMFKRFLRSVCRIKIVKDSSSGWDFEDFIENCIEIAYPRKLGLSDFQECLYSFYEELKRGIESQYLEESGIRVITKDGSTIVVLDKNSKNRILDIALERIPQSRKEEFRIKIKDFLLSKGILEFGMARFSDGRKRCWKINLNKLKEEIEKW